MNLLKNILLVSALGVGISNAGTLPCNGFKIYFKNDAHQTLVMDSMHFVGGKLTTSDPLTIETNKELQFTVNESDAGNMLGEFSLHTTTEPLKEIKINFSLTNQDMVCEVGNLNKEGALHIESHRVLGGEILSIKD